MKRLVLLIILLFALATSSFGDNTHGTPNPQQEMGAWFGDLSNPTVVSGCLPVVPSSSLILGAFACKGYVTGASGELVYVTQAAATLTLTNVNGSHWLALHRDTSSAVSGWTRRAGTHYLFRQTASQPADPSGGLVFAKVTVAGGAITDVQRLYVDGGPRILDVTHAPYNAPRDGTGNAATGINQALTDATAGGYTVYVPCGTYKTTAQILLKDNVWLQGGGRDCTIIAPDTGTSIARPILASSVSNWLVSDLQVDCGDATIARQGIAALNTASYGTVDRVKVKRCGQYGVLLHGDTSATPFSSGGGGMVLRNSLIDMTGIPAGACTGTIAVEYFPKGPSGYLATPGPLIEGNTVLGDHVDVGIKMSQATGGRILGNRVEGVDCSTSTGAIDLGPGGTNSVVAGNTVKSTRLGIVFGGVPRSFATGGNDLRTSKVVIAGNTLSFISAIGLFSSDGADDVLMQGNNVSLDTGTSAGTQGINFQPTAAGSGGADFNRMRILGNTFVGFETSIILQGTGALGFPSAQIEGNFVSTGSAVGTGIHLENANTSILSNNKVFGHLKGININASSAGVIVSGNNIDNTNTAGTAAISCIYVVGNRPVVTDNVCSLGASGHAKYGLTLNATVDATIHGNKWIAMETGDVNLLTTGSMTSGTPHFQELYVNQVAALAPADTTEDTIATVVLPASYFTLYGGVAITAFGDTSGAGGTKTIRLYFGGTQFAPAPALAIPANADGYRLEAEVVLPGGTAVQHTWLKGYNQSGPTLVVNGYTSMAVNTATGTVTIAVTCQKASAGDVCRHRSLVARPWR